MAGCLFSTLAPEELCQLTSYKHPLQVRRNTVLYMQGVPADGIYFLCHGTIKLVFMTGNGDERIVDFVKAGEMFGLDSLLPVSTRMFTAVARESCEVVYLDRKSFSRVLQSNLSFLWRFAAMLNVSLHRSQKSHLLLSGHPVRTKLKNAIVQCTGISELRQMELAQLLGVSAETVNRELHNPRAGSHRKKSASAPSG